MKKIPDNLDSLFAEFDETLALSRSIFSQVPIPQHTRWQQVNSFFLQAD